MNTTEIRTMDEIGRIVVPHNYRTALSWGANTALQANFCNKTNGVTLVQAQNTAPQAATVTVDNFGRVSLPKSMRTKLGLTSIAGQDTLEISINMMDRAVSLKRA